MKRLIVAAKESSRGVFWLIDDQLFAFPFYEGADTGVAKSGVTFNHQKLWDSVKPRGLNKPFNYYPRGRVDFKSDSTPIIYLNPNIGEKWIPQIKTKFGLRKDPIVHYDYSEHYKCYLDEEYKKFEVKHGS